MNLSDLPEYLKKLEGRVLFLEEKLREITTPDQVEQPVTIQAAADFLGIAKQTLYQRCCNRQVPHHKSGHKLIFFKSELSDYIKSRKRKVFNES